MFKTKVYIERKERNLNGGQENFRGRSKGLLKIGRGEYREQKKTTPGRCGERQRY